MPLKRGTQILYMPTEAGGDVDHPSCEEGFITSVKDEKWAYCRYWLMSNPTELRTKLSSEKTRIADLVVTNSVPQLAVIVALERWCHVQ